MSEESTASEEKLSGLFTSSLKRNNSKIREDRAESIGEDTEVVYRRKIEDLQTGLKKLSRDRNNMLDLSPTNADSLVLASDFDAEAFVDKDIEIGIGVRNIEIKLEIARDRYKLLFGKEI